MSDWCSDGPSTAGYRRQIYSRLGRLFNVWGRFFHLWLRIGGVLGVWPVLFMLVLLAFQSHD